MAMPQPKNRAAESTTIPDRLYFKIGDAARICGVKTYVLRFWETQFPQLKPNKSGTGQRLYRRRDVELALRIKQLVHEEGYTLAGARQVLEQVRGVTPTFPPEAPPEVEREPQSRLPLAIATALAQTPESVATAILLARAELREIAELLTADEPQTVRQRARVTAIPAQSESLFPL
jgi:DNA-binding transcriptional MerR regulator